MFAALNFRWVLVWICVIVFGFATQSPQGSALYVTQPSDATAKLTHPQLKTNTDDYYLNPDDDSNNQDQDLQVRAKTPKRQRDKISAAARITNSVLNIRCQTGKKYRRPTPIYPTSTSTPVHEGHPAVDELANQLAGIQLKSSSVSSSGSKSKRCGQVKSFLMISISRKSSKIMRSNSRGSKEEPAKDSPSMMDSQMDTGYHSA
nr:PREDICTED: uncharacterized protein LOC109033682 [Bemisia tabaci]